MLRSSFRLVVSMLLVSTVAAFAGCKRPAPADPKSADADLVVRAGAPLIEGMSEYHRPIKTRDPGSQRYFDQGMGLAFGFNHAEANRSIRAAHNLDTQSAMCCWGASRMHRLPRSWCVSSMRCICRSGCASRSK